MGQAFEQRRLRHLFTTITGATPESQNPDYWNGDIWWVTPEDLGKLDGHEVTSTKRAITQEGLASSATTVAVPGSLVFSKRAPIGQAAILRVEAACNQGCFLLTPSDNVDERFYYYALIHHRQEFEILGRGSTFMELSTDDLKSFKLPYPPLPLQRRIADYLDAETGRMDELIAAKRSMLALLEKKRAALVSQAVTKGLDPNATMKDSGLEWLGEIPEHWEVRRLGYLFSMQGGSTPSKANEDFWKGTIPWATPKDIKRPVLHDTIDHVADEVLTETGLAMIEPPVVLIVVRGMILARRIPTALTAVPMTINQDMKALTPNALFITADYLKLVFDGVQSAMMPLIEEAGHGTKVLRTDLLTSFKIPLPSLQHQQEIIDELDDRNKRSLLLEKELNTSITLLTSRRSALITAAVTGQVAVPGLVKA